MKKRFILLLLSFVLCFTSVYVTDMEANAEEIGEDVDYSSLLTEDALIGYATMQTRGVYLAEGTSIINDAGGGKIGAGGSTIAAISCKVSINAIVERKVNGSWVRVTSWTVTNTNAKYAIASKTIAVGSGYYYRVRCVHSASTDTSNSFTGALWM